MKANSVDKRNFTDMDYYLFLQRKYGKTIIDVDGVTELGEDDREHIEGKINTYISRLDKETMNNIHKSETKEKIRSDIYAIANEEKERFNEVLHPFITQIANSKIDGLLGYGAIQDLINDPTITEIMVNGTGRNSIFFEKGGRLFKANQYFESDEQLKNVINAIVAPLNKRIDESSPIVDARLPNGSRVNAVIAPIALKGCYLTIRKFTKNLTAEQLIENGSMTEEMKDFLKACVESCINTIVFGGTGSGKTTLLNVLSSFIPSRERIVTIEDTAELQLFGDHVVSMETRPPNSEGKGEITIQDLIRTSLRMRPDRIIVGEVRGAEATDMLTAMNTGHDGSLTTGHANNPPDLITRLEDMCMLGGLSGEPARRRISSAIQLIVEVQRIKKTGKRLIKSISTIGRSENNTIPVIPIFEYNPQTEKIEYTGHKPYFADKLLQEANYEWKWSE
ncbi:MAG: putative conjugal transfer protein [Firmicutes bacterium ADurb.Bin419]|nr:MAG: putative conjugal transfer protein [Firmicutes bacterium ADurb.Bin419]